MNPIEILKGFMGNGGNPQVLVNKALGMVGNNNPMIANLVNMAKSGNTQGIEQFARNYMKERGMDFDKEFASFMNNFNQR
jgi:hypothetical protein